MYINHLLAAVIEAIEKLDVLLGRIEQLEDQAEERRIIVRQRASGTLFFYSLPGGSKEQRYIRKEEIELIRKLARRDFLARLKKEAEEERVRLEKCRKYLDRGESSVRTVLAAMPQPLQMFVDTEIWMNEGEIGRWKEQRVREKNPWAANEAFTSANGERMRSKSEVLIADALRREGIPYFYEKPLDDLTGPYSIFPDFTCLNTRTGKVYYWEHCGLMENPDYCNAALNRIQNYAALGIVAGGELILTFESSRSPLRTHYIQDLIERFLK